jgi:TonB family protein
LCRLRQPASIGGVSFVRLTIVGLLCAHSSTLHAQNFLLVEHDKQGRVVRDFSENWPRVEIDHELVRANGRHQLFLQKTEAYALLFVSVSSFEAVYSYSKMVDEEFDNVMKVRGTFESPYHVHRAFFVLEFPRALAGRKILAGEIGELQPYQSKDVDAVIYLKPVQPLRVYSSFGARPDMFVHTSKATDFILRIFADGYEIFHSRMPPDFIESALDEAVVKRVKLSVGRSVQKLIGPVPRYPPALRAARLPGNATLAFKISPSGRVIDPFVKSASKPEFGDAAMAALRQWRFIPKVEHGTTIASAAELPFVFNPDEPN